MDDSEDLARFLKSSSHFNTVGAKPAAFLPPPGIAETSVFRHGAEPREALWRISQEHMEADRKVHAAAIVNARDIRVDNMDVVAEEPPPRHANIVGWATGEDPDLAKAKRIEQAARIAQRARIIRP